MNTNSNTDIPNKIEQHILDAVRQVKYGAVEVVIHNSRIVQVEKSEKTRFEETA